MKETLRIILLTLAIFIAGVCAGLSLHGIFRMPPPPFGPLGEIRPGSPPWGHGGPGREPWSQDKMREMKAEMEKLQPEIDAFQAKVQAIETNFRTKLDTLLTPEQRKLLPPSPQMGEKSSRPGGMGRAPSPFGGPLEGLAIFTIIRPALDHLTDELKLTVPQQVALKQLLLERRQQFLDLVDTTPPPSLKLGRFMRERPPK